jgi:hypothetical protein
MRAAVDTLTDAFLGVLSLADGARQEQVLRHAIAQVVDGERLRSLALARQRSPPATGPTNQFANRENPPMFSKGRRGTVCQLKALIFLGYASSLGDATTERHD